MINRTDMLSHIRLVTNILKTVGLWPNNFNYKRFDFYTIYFTFNFICICVGSTLPKVINLFIVDNLQEFTALLFVGVIEMAGIYKMCLYVKNLPLAKSIFDRLNNDQLNQPRNEHQQLMLTKLFKTWFIMMSILLAAGNSTVALWTLFPLMDRNERKLPFLAWYPFDSKQTPFYQFVYVHQIIGIAYYNLANVSLDGFYSGIMLCIASECQFLCDNLRNLYEFTRERLERQGGVFGGDQLNDFDDVEEDAVTDEYNNSLKVLVEHHRGILKLVDDTNTLFTYNVTFQLCSTVLTLCTSMFQLSVAKPLSIQFYSLICYVIGLTWEVLMYCWAGNEAMFSSNQISLAAYESKWIKSSIQFKKNLVFFIRATQKPIRLYALQFFTLSLQMFINILRMSWSYFCLLRQVNNK